MGRLEWSMNQSGLGPNAGQQDPQAAGDAAKAQAKEATTGAPVAGAAKGAAVGAIFGAITGDTGEGAAVGAVAGGLKGRQAKKQAEKQAEAQAEAKVAADNKAKLETIKKGMAASPKPKGIPSNRDFAAALESAPTGIIPRSQEALPDVPAIRVPLSSLCHYLPQLRTDRLPY